MSSNLYFSRDYVEFGVIEVSGIVWFRFLEVVEVVIYYSVFFLWYFFI